MFTEARLMKLVCERGKARAGLGQALAFGTCSSLEIGRLRVGGAALHFRGRIAWWITARSQPGVTDPSGNSGRTGAQEFSGPTSCSEQVARGVTGRELRDSKGGEGTACLGSSQAASLAS